MAQGEVTTIAPSRLKIVAEKLYKGGYGSSIGLVALFIIGSFLSPYFLTTINILNLLRQVCIYGFMSMGMTLVILAGGIDLSVGGIMTASSVLAAVLAGRVDTFLVFLLPTLLGCMFGLINGVIIAKFKVESFVITLGTQFIAFGLGYAICGGKTVLPADFPFVLDFLMNGFVGPIPFPIILLFALYIFFAFIMSYTSFGRYIHAIGGNEKAVRFCGVNVDLMKIAIYTISGVLSGFAGVMMLSRATAGDPTIGIGIVLTIIASVIVGGNHFIGGIGNVGFTLIGLLILGTISNLLTILGVVFYVQQIISGIIVIVAVVISTRLE